MFTRFELKLENVLRILFENVYSDKRDDILRRLKGKSIVVAGKLEKAKSAEKFLIKRAGIIAGFGVEGVIPIDHIHVDNSSIRQLKMGSLVAIRGEVDQYIRDNGTKGYSLFDIKDVTSNTDFDGYNALAAGNALDVLNVNAEAIAPEYIDELAHKSDNNLRAGIEDVNTVKKAIGSVSGKNLDKPIGRFTQEYIDIIKDSFEYVLRGQDEKYAYFHIYDTLVNKLILFKETKTHAYAYNNELLPSYFVYAYNVMKQIQKGLLSTQLISQMISYDSGHEYAAKGNGFIMRSLKGDEIYKGDFAKCVTALRDFGGLLKGYICPAGVDHNSFIKHFVYFGHKSASLDKEDWGKYFNLTPKANRDEHVASELSEKQKRAIEKRKAEKKKPVAVPKGVEVRKQKPRIRLY